MNKNIYIVTSSENKDFICSNDYDEIFRFVLKNPDSKFRVMNYNAKPKILRRTVFLENFYKKTENLGKLFSMVNIIFNKHKTNESAFISKMLLNTEYKQFKTNMR